LGADPGDNWAAAVNATLDSLVVEAPTGIFQSRQRSLIQQFWKLVRYHDAALMFTDTAAREIARIALGGEGARLRDHHAAAKATASG
jgi:ATP-dependent protease Clp ATPase subunit